MKRLKIADIISTESFDYYIYCDTAFSHEGDLKYLRSQIDSAAKANVNGIKFQILLDYKDSYTKNTILYNNAEKWCYSEEVWKETFKFAKSKGLEVIVLPVDLKALQFVKEQIDFIDAIEMHALLLNEIPFINQLENVDIPLILGIGGKSTKEITFIIEKFNSFSKKLKFDPLLMFGFQNYPTNFEQLNLSKLKTLKDKYDMPIGYADHTAYDIYKIGFEVMKYAFLFGVRIFEKHIVNEIGVKRIDYETALSSNELIELRKELESFIKILGNNDLDYLNEAEKRYKSYEKQLVVKTDLNKGDLLTEENLGYKASDIKSEFEQRDYEKLLNKKLLKPLKKDESIKREDVESKD